MEDEKTYSVREICSNCGKMATVTIPKGTFRNEGLKGKHCDDCGCLIFGGEKNGR